MNKLCISLTVLLMSFSAFAADDIINSEVREAFERTEQSMQDSVNQLDSTMQKIMPQISESIAVMMNDIMKTLPPLMSSIERNQVLSKASEELNKQFQENVKELNKSFENSTNQSTEEFSLSGTKSVNGHDLNFAFNQDTEALKTVSAIVDSKIAGGKNDASLYLTDLKNHKINATDVNLDSIDGNVILVYAPSNQEAFITGNFDNRINVKIQATGTDALKQAKDFIVNFRQRYAR